jgi:hypothetical protein
LRPPRQWLADGGGKEERSGGQSDLACLLTTARSQQQQQRNGRRSRRDRGEMTGRRRTLKSHAVLGRFKELGMLQTARVARVVVRALLQAQALMIRWRCQSEREEERRRRRRSTHFSARQ